MEATYDVVQCVRLPDLIKLVNHMARDGWQPLGGCFLAMGLYSQTLFVLVPKKGKPS